LNTPQTADQVIFDGGAMNPQRRVVGYLTEDERYLIVSTSVSTTGNELYFQDLGSPKSKLIPVITNFDNNHGVVDNDGTRLIIQTNLNATNDRIVEVAPYCAGLKMLFTSLYVGLMLLYWTGNWTSRTRICFFFSGVILISVTANIIRNTLLTFFHGMGQDQAFDWLHEGWGGDLYSTIMLILLVPLLRVIEQLIQPAQESEPKL